MNLNTEKLLERCYKGQWKLEDFDFTQPPSVELDKEKEMRVCSYYMNMSYIERMAGALFLALSKKMTDPTIKAIYESFHEDEIRHSQAALALMDYFDVHHYKVYTPSSAMLKFLPHFTKAVDKLNPAFANHLVLFGELILDIALLRGLNDYVDDPLSRAVVDKINSDESRHIAMDFYMTEYCSKHNMTAKNEKWTDNLSLIGVSRWAPEFFKDVFFKPMEMMDPEQKQLKDIMRRVRRYYLREEVQNNPMVQSFNNSADFFESTFGGYVGRGAENIVKRLSGLDLTFVKAGHTDNLALNRGALEDMGNTALAKAMAVTE